MKKIKPTYNANIELLKTLLIKKKTNDDNFLSKQEKLENYLKKQSSNLECESPEPVCGKNGITYKNKCLCKVDIAYVGTCTNYYEFQKFEKMKDLLNFFDYE